MPEYIDIHSHISFPEFDEDREAMMGQMKEKNIWAIDVGVDFDNSKKASENANANQGIFASAGLHPTDGGIEDFDAAVYKDLFANPKVVAVGECGLDYFRGAQSQISNLKTKNYKEKQIENFTRQAELALELDKPLMIHCRDAYVDLLEILRSYSKTHGSKLRGNMHFFAGNWKEAKEFLDLGFTLSFTGVVTFARDYDEVIKNAPIDMIMAETDSPFVAPAPRRGKRNEPIYVAEVVKKIAQIRGEDEDKIKDRILKNSLKMFALKS
ncbi:MAG: TatD family hydrolase [Patescibacteria group bacterium]|nr:TatD family hydrolase [Patescibacteria group bacterium]MDE1988649.1 TatD family hydrolase [Patescibacteria group bacterium]MDE2218113.1 TatD family hydrolase [Patescibacteria group bacterium]